MAHGIPFQEIEKKWQEIWKRDRVYRAIDPSPESSDPSTLRHGSGQASLGEKFYGLIEFPYPSGEGLHVGHPRSYTAIDIVTRKKRMEGKNVLYPIGWDAFGLPTENFAIKNKVKPRDATKKNIANFTRQLASLGFGFDWSREVNTTDPMYYKWTQWMFLTFFKSYFDDMEGCAKPIEKLIIPDDVGAGLPRPERDAVIRAYIDSHRMAYKAESAINWCPQCNIGLAKEEAQGGVCERCGAPVEERRKSQWMIRITKYADRLLRDLDTVDYLEKIKAQQINWIGRSEGANIDFVIASAAKQSFGTPRNDKLVLSDRITVFTTRPDTLFGATYLVLAPEYELVERWIREKRIANAQEVIAYRDLVAQKTEIERQNSCEKTGVELEGLAAENPATGEQIPIWIADYVLGGYGTGAIMAVPAHDERDFEFAKRFGLPVQQVVAPVYLDDKNPPRIDQRDAPRRNVVCIIKHWAKDEILCLKWKVQGQDWQTFIIGGVEASENLIEAAIREIHEETGYLHPKFIRPCGREFIAKYFAAHKNENRIAHAIGLYFELQDGERKLISEEEIAKHDIVWIAKDKVSDFVRGAGVQEELLGPLMNWGESPLLTKEGTTGEVWTGDGIAINSGFLNGLPTAEAKEKIIECLETNNFGHRTTTYKLRDWVFSRQRYWGEPIPIIICKTCGFVPVPENELPLLLPEVDAYEPTDTGESPLAKIRNWVEVTCPSCGGNAERETDTMPNWAGSSWYFLRYCDPHNDQAFADPKKLRYWMPVDLYNGGMEHTTLHLLYSRFWYKFLWDLGYVPRECGSEPYAKRRSHGLILGEGGVKMSKSKGNVVNPDDVVEKYGADVFRVYEMFIGSFDQDAPWDTNGIEGVKRFLEKVWRLFEAQNAKRKTQNAKRPTLHASLESLLHQTIKKVGDDIEAMRFNTAVSAMMIFVNAMTDECVGAESFLKILAPFAPHLAEELWHQLGHKTTIHREPWPSFDPRTIIAETFELVVQVNGKVRDRITVASDITEEEATNLALASEKVKIQLGGKEPQKVIFVPGRLLSISI